MVSDRVPGAHFAAVFRSKASDQFSTSAPHTRHFVHECKDMRKPVQTRQNALYRRLACILLSLCSLADDSFIDADYASNKDIPTYLEFIIVLANHANGDKVIQPGSSKSRCLTLSVRDLKLVCAWLTDWMFVSHTH